MERSVRSGFLNEVSFDFFAESGAQYLGVAQDYSNKIVACHQGFNDDSILEAMAKARCSIKFILSPAKTGRTSLAFKYASRYHHLNKVIWLDDTSFALENAFLSGNTYEKIDKQLLNVLTKPSLVILDNMHCRSNLAGKEFAAWLDKINALGIEIIVISAPDDIATIDTLASQHIIDGTALLKIQEQSHELNATRCIHILTNFFASAVADELKQLAAIMILMKRGMLNNILALGYEFNADDVRDLTVFCPLVSYDSNTQLFDSLIPEQELTCELIVDLLLTQLGTAKKQDSLADANCNEICFPNSFDESLTSIFCCFERLTQISNYLFERAEIRQSQNVLKAAALLLQTDCFADETNPIEERAVESVAVQTESMANAASQAHIDKISLQANDNDAMVANSATTATAQVHNSVTPKFATLASTSQIATAALHASALHPACVLQSRPNQTTQVSGQELVTIRLFGDFEVFLGGKRLPAKDLQRKKVLTLALHLALNMGRGISRDILMDKIWPEKDYERARENFYTTWSKLNAIFYAGAEQNRYLYNNRGLCRFNDQIVRTDVQEFEELCRLIIFEKGTSGERMDAAFRLEQIYRGDILSGCYIDDHIMYAQERYRAMLVDALLGASRLFSNCDQDTNAVWFARRAYETDSTREDVYQALMAVQERAGQRTSALQTYFDCKRFLSEELGIMPSQKTRDLYQNLILDTATN